MDATGDCAQHTDSAPADSPAAETRSRPLCRPANGRMIGGVVAGFGQFLGVDPKARRAGLDEESIEALFVNTFRAAEEDVA